MSRRRKRVQRAVRSRGILEFCDRQEHGINCAPPCAGAPAPSADEAAWAAVWAEPETGGEG